MRKLKKNSGVVLLMVLIVVVVLAMVSASILFSSLNQTAAPLADVDAIKRKQLAQGTMWVQVYQGFSGGAQTAEPMDGKIYTPTVEPGAAAGQYKVKVTSP